MNYPDHSMTADINELEIAYTSAALFEQYDEIPDQEAANDEDYENLYPFIA